MALRSTTLAVVFAFLLINSTPAKAQSEEWSKKSVLTLQDSFEVPGMVLKPGTYVLKADDNSGNPRTLVRLLSQDESQTLTTFVAIPDNRMRPESDVVVTFFNGVIDGPKSVQTWYYPGEMNGYEFVYPKARAKEIAKHTDDHVMASDSKDGAIVAVTSSGTEVPIYDAVARTQDKAATSDPQPEKPQVPTTSQAATKRSRRLP